MSASTDFYYMVSSCITIIKNTFINILLTVLKNTFSASVTIGYNKIMIADLCFQLVTPIFKEENLTNVKVPKRYMLVEPYVHVFK